MKRTAVLLTALVLLGALVGCSTDRKGEIVTKVAGQLGEAVRATNAIRTELESAISKAEKKKEEAVKDKKDDAKKIYLAKEDLNATFKAMKGLREVGQKLVDYGEFAKAEKPKPTDEERQELARNFVNRFNPQWEELKKANEKLKVAVERAAGMTDAPTARELRTELRNARQEFVTLTRQH